MKAYLDNGATTRVAEEVVEAMLPYYTERFGNASSLHSYGGEAAEALENARKVLAGKINAEPEEIVFTSGGSESDNLAIKGTAYSHREKGNHIITTKAEHHAVMETCSALEKEGFDVSYLDVDGEGFVDLKGLEKAIRKETILVSIIHANNEIGTVQDIAAIGKLCRKKGVVFHTDAVQSLAKEKIDVKKQDIDLASFSAHKIHGPKGAGALFVRKGLRLKKLIDGGPQERNLRAGTENIPGIVGFAKAVELMKDKDARKMAGMRDYLLKEIEEKVPDIILNGPREKRLCNNLNIAFKYVEGESMLLKLDMKGIAVSTGSACSSKSLEPSHVLKAIGMPKEHSHGSIRFTLSRHTTKDEIDYTVNALIGIIEELRAISPLKKGVKIE